MTQWKCINLSHSRYKYTNGVFCIYTVLEQYLLIQANTTQTAGDTYSMDFEGKVQTIVITFKVQPGYIKTKGTTKFWKPIAVSELVMGINVDKATYNIIRNHNRNHII